MNVYDWAFQSLNDQRLFTVLDLAGTFAFAISGAVAAKNRGLDWFGVLVIAFTVACGGGVLRDLCLGAVPPTGISDWRYLATAMAAALMAMGANTLVVRLAHPVTLFDSLGLGLFAVTGAQKAMALGHNAEVALLVGVMGAVGGGVLRDVLLNRVPVILQREIYALAALAAAAIEVAGERLGWVSSGRTWVALLACFALRYLSLRYKWNLPRTSR
ncbi:conserved membrane hypothetical protein [Burkholderiales bacterium 8X]|nr:conserved membrane hypothetical protein [Burkholderiales bacterium 8X]